MIVGASIFLWLLALVLAARLARITWKTLGVQKAAAWVWLAAMIAAACVLFRPHEDIFGGEDAGSYINSGITYGRLLSFFHVDPLLSQVPPDVRPLFYYGHAGYGTTKDVCMWVRDGERALIGPHFQPAYPLLISTVTRAGGPFTALYVLPLFTLFASLAVGALAQQCLGHRWSGFAASVLYLMNPLVLWHGRIARPEIIASFLFFGGAALLLHAWRNKPFAQWPDILLGTLSIGFAPFFHITAWLLAIPAACVVVAIILHGRDDFLLIPVIALLPVLLFSYQVLYITDSYRIAHFFMIPYNRIFLFSALALFMFFVLTAACLAAKRLNYARANKNEAGNLSLPLAALLAATTIAFFVVSYVTRDPAGSLPILGRPIDHYLYLTDLKALVNMISRPVALLALAGWAAWLTGRGEFRRTRAVMALALLPGIMLAGKINDFMMTRYFLVTVIPVSALSMAALVSLIPNRRSVSALSAVLAILIGLGGLNNRAHLVKTTEHRGFARFLEPFAAIITEAEGILLCEYSRIAAPFDHFFGIPTLGLDNERKHDYARQEEAWERIMQNDPDRPAFFITPFQRPLSDRFDFTLLRSAVFDNVSLQQAYNNLPTQIKRGPIPLHLYRMTLKEQRTHEMEMTDPFVITMNSGNMGLRGFANVRIRTRPVKGMELHPGEPVSLDFSSCPDFKHVRELLFLFISDKTHTQSPIVVNQQGRAPDTSRQHAGRWLHIADQWWLLRVENSAAEDQKTVVIETMKPVFLGEVFMVTDDQILTAEHTLPPVRTDERIMQPFRARWTRAEAEAVVPATSGGGIALLFFSAPDIRQGLPADFSISAGTSLAYDTRKVDTERWQWQAWPLGPADSEENYLWLQMHISPAWNSGIRGFPSDLGVLMGYIVVLNR